MFTHNEDPLFTITFIVDGDDSKLLFSTSEFPAKADEEASGVIYKADLPEYFDKIVSKIPLFRDIRDEDGAEETITRTIDDFNSMYDIDILDLISKGDDLLNNDNQDQLENDIDKDDASEDDAYLHTDPTVTLDDLDNSDSYYTDPSDIFYNRHIQ